MLANHKFILMYECNLKLFTNFEGYFNIRFILSKCTIDLGEKKPNEIIIIMVGHQIN